MTPSSGSVHMFSCESTSVNHSADPSLCRRNTRGAGDLVCKGFTFAISRRARGGGFGTIFVISIDGPLCARRSFKRSVAESGLGAAGRRRRCRNERPASRSRAVPPAAAPATSGTSNADEVAAADDGLGSTMDTLDASPFTDKVESCVSDLS